MGTIGLAVFIPTKTRKSRSLKESPLEVRPSTVLCGPWKDTEVLWWRVTPPSPDADRQPGGGLIVRGLNVREGNNEGVTCSVFLWGHVIGTKGQNRVPCFLSVPGKTVGQSV